MSSTKALMTWQDEQKSTAFACSKPTAVLMSITGKGRTQTPRKRTSRVWKASSLRRRERRTQPVIPMASKAVDSVGSGDAFFAISSLAIKLGAPFEIAGFLGNVAGALAVQIIGNQKAIDKPSLTKYVTSLLK